MVMGIFVLSWVALTSETRSRGGGGWVGGGETHGVNPWRRDLRAGGLGGRPDSAASEVQDDKPPLKGIRERGIPPKKNK